jgi:hypothetical protein
MASPPDWASALAATATVETRNTTSSMSACISISQDESTTVSNLSESTFISWNHHHGLIIFIIFIKESNNHKN